MPLVRKNPMPAGRYWIDVPKPARKIWDLFVKKNSDILKVEQDKSDTWLPGCGSIDWVLFTLSDLAIWPRGIGFPNSADASVKARPDVHQAPPSMTEKEAVKEVARDIATTASEAASSAFTTALLIGLAIYVFTKGK